MFNKLKAKLTNQPYFLFLITGVALIITTAFTFGQTVDFHLHDTYFVVSVNYFIWVLSALLIIAWILYKLTDRFLWTKTLTWTHVLATIFLLLSLSTIEFWYDKMLPPVKREVISFQDIMDDQKRTGIIAYPIVVIFVLGQAAYIVNLVVGITRRWL
ncbi:MAG: hypothetical protein KIT80_03235 [Chitinophagaceae bacterium]|nr:hypothetical protein [Chitinophagaceae bacterium]MCW5925899.1 hypothetical protein [Chitinophagaceae bacterium]